MMTGNMNHNWVGVLARVLIASVFIYAGYNKLVGIEGTAGYIVAMMGVSAGVATILAWSAAIVEFVGGILIAVGWWKKLAAWALVVFTLIATYYFHLKIAMAGGDGASMQWVSVLKNLGLIGGLMLIGKCLCSGGWMDRCGCQCGGCEGCSGGNCGGCGSCKIDKPTN